MRIELLTIATLVSLLVQAPPVLSAGKATTPSKKAPALSKTDEFKIALWKARYFKRWQQAELALPLYEKLAKMQPNNSEVHAGLGWALWQTHQPDAAFAEQYKAISLDPKNPVPHHHLAAMFMYLGMNPQAADEFRAEYSIDPKRNCHCGPSEGLMLQYPPGASEVLGLLDQQNLANDPLKSGSGKTGNKQPAAKKATGAASSPKHP